MIYSLLIFCVMEFHFQWHGKYSERERMNSMIYIITHRKFNDEKMISSGYGVLHVGKNDNCKEYYLRDDTMDNIAYKNPYYCELTGLYWIWKNGKEHPEDITGLIHYRRGFTDRFSDFKYSIDEKNIPRILSEERIDKILKKYEMIVPVSIKCRKTSYICYGDFHWAEDLDFVRKSIEERCPEYLRAYDKALNGHYYYTCNMFITKKKILDRYASWLFDVYEALEPKINIEKYEDAYQRRVFGFLSERLLSVWLLHNNISYIEMPIFNTEKKSLNVITAVIEKIRWYVQKNT